MEAVAQCLDKYAGRQEVLAHACGLLCMLAAGGVHRTAPVPPAFTAARRWSAACAVPAVLASLQVRLCRLTHTHPHMTDVEKRWLKSSYFSTFRLSARRRE